MRKASEVPDIVVEDGKPIAVILDIKRYRDLLIRLGDKDGLDSLQKALDQAEHIRDCGF